MKHNNNYFFRFIAILSIILFNMFILQGQVQIIQVKSKIVDEQGIAVKDAMVTNQNGKILMRADTTGGFTLEVPDSIMLYFHAPQFSSQMIMAKNISGNIVLIRDNKASFINMPYRKVKKELLPGGVTVLNAEEYIDNDYNRSIIDGTYGRIPGAIWYNNLWGMQDAQVIIDGIPRDFGDIVFDEVEQITVLKGAHAVALYGSIGSKGVILVTTKRGDAFKRKVNVRANSSIGTPRMFPDYLSAADYMTLYNEARKNDGLPILYTDSVIQLYRSGNRYKYPDINYYSSDYLKNFVNNYNADVEFSGGNNTAKFYTNIGYDFSNTLLKIGEGKNENDQRFNARGNVDLQLNDYISNSLDVSTVFIDSRRSLGNYWNSASTILPFKYSPLIPINAIHSDSAYEFVKASRNIIDGKYLLGGSQEYLTNPIANLYVGGYNKNVQRILQVTNKVHVNLNNVVEGLSFTSRIHADYSNWYNQSINNNYAVYNPVWSNDSIIALTKYGNDYRPGVENINNTWQSRNIGASVQFNYDRKINDDNQLTGLILASAMAIQSTGVYQPSKFANIGMQLTYFYKEKYGIDFIGMFINSTKLPKKNRVGFSPSVSLNWLTSKEDFMSSVSFINWLKLSAAFSMLKSDIDIDNYFLYENYYASQGWFAWNDNLNNTNNSATVSLRGANPDLNYPSREEVNFYIESKLFNNHFDLNANVFVIRQAGLLTQRYSQYPGYIGPFIPYTNYNTNQYAGFDFSLAYQNVVSEKLKFQIGYIGTYVKSKVIKRDELYAFSYQNRTGKPVDAIFGLQSKGFFADENDIKNSPVQLFGEVKPGDIKYVDQNGDNVIDQNDEVMIGHWIAPYTHGIHLTVDYSNFSFFILSTGSIGGYGVKTNDYYWVDGDDKYSTVVLNRWTEATKNTATYPRLSSVRNENNFRYSDFWLYKTDRLNIDKVQLTYRLPKKLLGRGYLKDFNVYVNASNLFTFSPNKDVLNLNINSAPQLRYYSLGLKANF